VEHGRMSVASELPSSSQPTIQITLPEQAGGERELRPGDRIARRYRLQEVIGRGGMATVYRARDERLQRAVAVKVSHWAEELPAPPLREELVASALIHPNIVAIFDGGEIPAGEPGAGACFIVMEYVPGTTASARAPLPWRQVVDIVAQTCDGLAAAHARGIVHCDVKPGNILIDESGRVRVVDFGVAATMESAPADYVHGSPAYIAPERQRGARPDPRMDVFGLGGLLAFLLTGQHLDRDQAAFTLPPSCPRDMAAVIARARSHDPARRYPDAAAFKEAVLATSDPAQARQAVPSTVAHARLVPTAPADARVIRARTQSTRAAGRRTPLAGLMRSRVWRSPAVMLVAAVVLALLLGGALLLPRLLDGKPGTAPVAAAVAMPDVRDQSFGAALEGLAQQGLHVERVDVVYGPGPLNQVVAQEPEPGTAMHAGDEVVLIVRTGR